MVGNEFLPPWLPQAELERHNKNTPQRQLCSPNAHVASSTVGDVWRCSIWAINRFTEVTRADLLNELSDLERSRQDSRAVFQPSEDLMRGQPPIHKTGDYSRHNPRRLASRPQTSTPQNSEKEVLLFKLSSQRQVVIVSWAHDNITVGKDLSWVVSISSTPRPEHFHLYFLLASSLTFSTWKITGIASLPQINKSERHPPVYTPQMATMHRLKSGVENLKPGIWSLTTLSHGPH